MHLITVKPEEVFQALADRTRIRIMRLLVDTGEEICLCELVDSLQELQYKLSRHLKTLRQAGLLTRATSSHRCRKNIGPIETVLGQHPILQGSRKAGVFFFFFFFFLN